MTPRLRLLSAVLVGLLGVIIGWFFEPDPTRGLVDTSWALNAARDLLAGRDPYRHTAHTNLIPYPLTAAVVMMPFALLPGSLGVFVFFGLASGLLAYGMLRDGQPWRLFTFLGPGFVLAAFFKQWTPLLMAAIYYPLLSFVLVAKPTLGPPVVLTAPFSRRTLLVAGGISAAIVLISLALMPDWPWRWIGQVGDYSGLVPLLTWMGPLLALALLRVRERGARLLLLMALIPQQTYFYDQLLLWYLPQTARQILLLSVWSWLVLLVGWYLSGTLYGGEIYVLLGVYLPALALVLLPRRPAPPVAPAPPEAPAASAH